VTTEGLYDSLDIHRAMLRDAVRNDAYHAALTQTVRPGDVVIDVGAGTGILSMLAVQAGAAQVYAVERGAAAHVAVAMAAANGMADRIAVVQGDIERVLLPQRADVIVSEWLGVYGVDENLLAPVLTARDRWLKPAGSILPDRVVSYLAPVWVEALDYLRSAPYGLDLSPVASRDRDGILWPRVGLTAGDVQASPQPMWTLDLNRFPAREARRPFAAALSFAFEEHASVNALAAWFSAGFGDATTLSNAPGEPRTHWNQFLFPLDQPRAVAPGDVLEARFTCVPAGAGYCQHVWAVRSAGQPWEQHDTRRGAGPEWQEL
jgi:SAM-dependent methyltransferase